MSQYYLGLDLGQVKDFTAIAVVERLEPVLHRFDYVTWLRTSVTPVPVFSVRHLERVRLGTPYPVVVERVRQMVRRPEMRGQCTLVVDGTGVGRAVVDLLHDADLDCELVPVQITGGTTARREGRMWSVPKRDLISVVQVLLQQDRLRVAADLPGVKTLIEEMMAMRIKLTTEGREQFGAWREGTHDDLALAMAMACWKARWDETPVGEQHRRLTF